MFRQGVFIGRIQDIRTISEWSRGVLHTIYGPVVGEEMYRLVRAAQVCKLLQHLDQIKG